MFTADPSMRTPFMKEEMVQYKRAVELIKSDRPMVMVAPTFMSTRNATDLLSKIMPVTSFDQADRQRAQRYSAYIDTVWVDAPMIVVTMINNSAYKPVVEYRMQTNAHRVWLTAIGKMDLPMIIHEERNDYDMVLKWNNRLQSGQRLLIHQILNSRPKLEMMLLLNRLQHNRDDTLVYVILLIVNILFNKLVDTFYEKLMA